MPIPSLRASIFDEMMRLVREQLVKEDAKGEKSLPFGRLRCTADRYPRVIEVDDGLLSLLSLRRDSEQWMLVESNIFFLVPEYERATLRRDLDAARLSDTPVGTEHRVCCGDGRQANLACWLRLVQGENDTESFYELVYMELPQSCAARENRRIEAYRHALSLAYDGVYEVDTARGIAECLTAGHDRSGDIGVRMTLESLLEKRLFIPVLSEDKEALDTFLRRSLRSDGGIARLTVRTTSEEGAGECGVLVFPSAENSVTVCCRDLAQRARSASPAKAAAPRATVRTFGYFDLFVDGKPVMFPYEKSKELLAVLVDRGGSFVSNSYIISCLWEDEPYGERVQSRCRQAAFRLMKTLEKYGVSDIVEVSNGRRRIVPERVQCDYFDFLWGERSARRYFSNAYMSDYSWGEVRLSELLKLDA